MRKLLIALMVLPLAALAQGEPGAKAGASPREADPVRLEKRMRLARTLGFAEALDLDTAQALKLGDTLSRFDDRRKAIRKQASDARDALRRAAANEKASAAEVDAAVGKLVDARTQLTALDKEMLQAVTTGLTPDKKARAALFLGRFRDRVERHVMMFGPGPGPGDGGMRGHGRMHGPGASDDGPHGMMQPRKDEQWASRARAPGGQDQLSCDGPCAFEEPPPFMDDDED